MSAKSINGLQTDAAATAAPAPSSSSSSAKAKEKERAPIPSTTSNTSDTSTAMQVDATAAAASSVSASGGGGTAAADSKQKKRDATVPTFLETVAVAFRNPELHAAVSHCLTEVATGIELTLKAHKTHKDANLHADCLRILLSLLKPLDGSPPTMVDPSEFATKNDRGFAVAVSYYRITDHKWGEPALFVADKVCNGESVDTATDDTVASYEQKHKTAMERLEELACEKDVKCYRDEGSFLKAYAANLPPCLQACKSVCIDEDEDTDTYKFMALSVDSAKNQSRYIPISMDYFAHGYLDDPKPYLQFRGLISRMSAALTWDLGWAIADFAASLHDTKGYLNADVFSDLSQESAHALTKESMAISCPCGAHPIGMRQKLLSVHFRSAMMDMGYDRKWLKEDKKKPDAYLEFSWLETNRRLLAQVMVRVMLLQVLDLTNFRPGGVSEEIELAQLWAQNKWDEFRLRWRQWVVNSIELAAASDDETRCWSNQNDSRRFGLVLLHDLVKATKTFKSEVPSVLTEFISYWQECHYRSDRTLNSFNDRVTLGGPMTTWTLPICEVVETQSRLAGGYVSRFAEYDTFYDFELTAREAYLYLQARDELDGYNRSKLDVSFASLLAHVSPPAAKAKTTTTKATRKAKAKEQEKEKEKKKTDAPASGKTSATAASASSSSSAAASAAPTVAVAASSSRPSTASAQPSTKKKPHMEPIVLTDDEEDDAEDHKKLLRDVEGAVSILDDKIEILARFRDQNGYKAGIKRVVQTLQRYASKLHVTPKRAKKQTTLPITSKTGDAKTGQADIPKSVASVAPPPASTASTAVASASSSVGSVVAPASAAVPGVGSPRTSTKRKLPTPPAPAPANDSDDDDETATEEFVPPTPPPPPLTPPEPNPKRQRVHRPDSTGDTSPVAVSSAAARPVSGSTDVEMTDARSRAPVAVASATADATAAALACVSAPVSSSSSVATAAAAAAAAAVPLISAKDERVHIAAQSALVDCAVKTGWMLKDRLQRGGSIDSMYSLWTSTCKTAKDDFVKAEVGRVAPWTPSYREPDQQAQDSTADILDEQSRDDHNEEVQKSTARAVSAWDLLEKHVHVTEDAGIWFDSGLFPAELLADKTKQISGRLTLDVPRPVVAAVAVASSSLVEDIKQSENEETLY